MKIWLQKNMCRPTVSSCFILNYLSLYLDLFIVLFIVFKELNLYDLKNDEIYWHIWFSQNASSFPPLVPVASTLRHLRSLALAVAGGKPVMLQGAVGSGKTSLVEHLAGLTHRKLIKIQLGDQTDSKVMLRFPPTLPQNETNLGHVLD